MEMNKNNVLLIEKQNVVTTNAVKDNEDKIVMLKGLRLVRVIKPLEEGYDVIAQYDYNTDSIDLTNLHNYENFFLCSVDIAPKLNDEYENKLVWNCCTLGNGSEDSTIFSVKDGRECTSDEVKLLNDVFVGFYDEAVNNMEK